MKNNKNFGFSHKCGILLPISSLPSKYGIGSFGKEAYEFVDFLADTHQKCWQVLPLNPTSYGDSPYQSPSSVAGNPYFIDLDILAKQGLLTKEELLLQRENSKLVNYGWLFGARYEALRTAYSRFKPTPAYRKFVKKKLYSAGISKIEIERASDRVKVIIYTAKPGVVIGKGGATIRALTEETGTVIDLEDDGTVKIAIDALQSAKSAHTFLSVTKFGHSAIVKTLGNEDCHIILRGGNKGPNYSVEHVSEAVEALSKAKLIPSVMVDFSHANSNKQFKKQVEVAENIAEQISSGSKGVFGVMIESHLVEGRQDLVEGCADKLVYGQSITDACIGWEDSELVLEKLSQAIVARRNK